MKKYPHLEGCKCGAREEELPLPKNHDWWVNSEAYHNCFWTYLRNNPHPHTLNEIANLMGVSISAITSIERKAMEKLGRRASYLKK